MLLRCKYTYTLKNLYNAHTTHYRLKKQGLKIKTNERNKTPD